jgi:hypothetical protein
MRLQDKLVKLGAEFQIVAAKVRDPNVRDLV